MTTLQHKIDFAAILRVRNANPNGDPLNGNRPRTDYSNIGEMTDVCIKRKIRDRLSELNRPILIQPDDRKTDNAKSIKDRLEKNLGKDFAAGNPKSLIEKACSTWFDVRAFGQVIPLKGNKGKGSKKKTGDDADDDNSGDTGISIGIRGPVTIQSAFSVHPIDIESTQITKSTSLEGDGISRKSDQMGMKYRVDHGIYVFFGSMNPQLAERTGFSDEDAEAIKAVLPRLFENDESSARPAGSMEVLKVIWWKHDSKQGRHSSAKVHRSLKVNPDGGYTLDPLDGLDPDEIDGH